MKREDIKINPTIPEDFYRMGVKIKDMSIEVLDEWFDVPYIQTRGENNEYSAVMCLDGGAWDRPTLKGIFDSEKEAVDFILENYEDVDF
jgi:hypothetical protein